MNKLQTTNYKLQTKRGFTLIELLVVIAIIGVLASVVLASLNTARLKSRDARRIADIKQIQLALELYYDANSASYPTALTMAALGTALAPTYIPGVPNDPSGGTATYTYHSLADNTAGASNACTAGNCRSYVLKAVLEANNSSALNNDIEGTIGTGSVDCTDTAANFFYCVRP
jgi:prepilin-type N-terminal cleavage/methylation domain-containing protein